MTPQAQQILSYLRVSGVDGRGALFIIAEILIDLERGTTCDMMEIMTMLRRIVCELPKEPDQIFTTEQR